MSVLDIFEELRFVIELVAAELMFTHSFAKKRNHFKGNILSGELILCILSVLYIFVKNYVVNTQSEELVNFMSVAWYVLLLVLTLVLQKVCFEITTSDVLFIGISGYVTMHMEYVIVNEVLAIGIWPEVRENLLLYVVICAVSCILWYAVIIRIFAGKLKACAGRLYENSKDTNIMFSLLILLMLSATFIGQGIFHPSMNTTGHVNYIGALMDFFVCVLVLVVQYSAFRINTLSREKEIVTQLLYERQKQYQLSKENIELSNHKCHDLKHQLQAIKQADSETFKQYISEVEDTILIYDHVLETENEVLNTILTEKSLYCERHKVKLSCIADAAVLDFMSTMDIYALLGNALDNAIEAVSKYEDESKRVVSFTISGKDNFLSIQTNNYFEGELLFKNGLPLSTKRRNRFYHGFGMKSMKHLTEKYGGTMYVKAEQGIFMLQIVIPLPQEFVRLLNEAKENW